MGQTTRSRSQGKKQWYPQKGLITRNTHVKYQSSSTYCSKVISKVKVSERRTEWQNDRITELQNDRITEWQNDRMTDRTKTICPPDLRSRGHKNLLRRSWIFTILQGRIWSLLTNIIHFHSFVLWRPIIIQIVWNDLSSSTKEFPTVLWPRNFQ